MKRKKDKPQPVRVFDLKTKRIMRIPESELAPGMIQARVEGVPGVVWIDSANTVLKPSPHRHPPFEGKLRADIEEIQRLLSASPYNKSFDEWEDGFRRDSTPEAQIREWLVAARTFEKHSSGKSAAVKAEVFNLVVACLNAEPDSVMQVFHREHLSKEQARSLVDDFWKAHEVPPSPPSEDNSTGFPEFRGTASFIRSYQSRTLIKGADIILTLPVSPNNEPELFFGKKVLEQLIAGMSEKEVSGVCYRIDWDTDEPETLLAAIEVLKGHHERGQSGSQ